MSAIIAATALKSPYSIPGYRLEERLHAWAEVSSLYRALDLRRDDPVLLSVIGSPLVDDRHYRERFERQARLLADFEHPALAPVVESGQAEGLLFQAVEQPPGVSLEELLADGPLSAARALAILEPVANLLERLHERRIVAGEISPRTIFVGPGDRPWLTQVGIADLSVMRRRPDDVPHDMLAYAATEQLRGMRPGPRTDVYSLAVVLFETITGTRPFRLPGAGGGSESLARALIARRALPVPAVSGRRLGLGPQVDAVLKHGLADEPGLRTGSPGELMYRFRLAVQQGGGLTASGRERPAPARAGEGDRPRIVVAPAARSRTGGRPVEGGPAARGRGAEIAPGDEPLWAAGPEEIAAPGAGRRSPARASSGRSKTPFEPHAAQTHARARQPEAPARPRPGRAAVARRRVLLIAVPATIAAAVLGSVLAGDRESPRTPAPATPGTVTASTGALRLSYPSTWKALEPAPRVPGLELRDPFALAPRSSGGGQAAQSWLLAGLADATDARLLPVGLGRRMVAEPTQEAVRLGGHLGYRYRDVRLDGRAAALTMYVVPTTEGVATLACSAGPAAPGVAGECEAIATTLAMSRGGSLPLGPNRAYGARLTEVIGRLDARRRAGRQRLQQAKTVVGQGRLAGELAAVFGQAANSLARGSLPPGTAEIHPRLLSDLRAVRASYQALAAAAGDRDRRAFNAARRKVVTSEAGLSRTLAGLRALGYQLR